eukprot:CAMPEP_0113897462 /NCGR_PEP_ID=MMETSP0780_2-20120614/18695_1 /TAXON_ID=652834 /ORGANISM="Palpitomonas bilix" /LENGTH=288 /DNA_ID=CAMNT_0000888933 /DNA_START=1525 /DNA_END=2391 /DNA_ORIENTATION=- /assembly_acc=CAM_ASM_000599
MPILLGQKREWNEMGFGDGSEEEHSTLPQRKRTRKEGRGRGTGKEKEKENRQQRSPSRSGSPLGESEEEAVVDSLRGLSYRRGGDPASSPTLMTCQHELVLRLPKDWKCSLSLGTSSVFPFQPGKPGSGWKRFVSYRWKIDSDAEEYLDFRYGRLCNTRHFSLFQEEGERTKAFLWNSLEWNCKAIFTLPLIQPRECTLVKQKLLQKGGEACCASEVFTTILKLPSLSNPVEMRLSRALSTKTGKGKNNTCWTCTLTSLGRINDLEQQSETLASLEHDLDRLLRSLSS